MKKNRLNILYEDKDIIVVNKPYGLLTVSTDNEKENTLFHQVFTYLKHKNKNNKVFIVHRLDKETSGIVLFAKNEALKNAFQYKWNDLVKKRGYVAIVEGQVKPKTKTIKSWLKETSTLYVYSSDKLHDGQLAITKYNTITSNQSYSFLEINILTGRKNQIRVHMHDINHPIVGDTKYGSTHNPLRRMGLHANILELEHPLTGQLLSFETDIPDIFISFFYK